MTDEELIQQTIKLAEKGRGKVNPNPLVGAIVLKQKKIVGQGYHQVFGGEHAEIVALNALNGLTRDGELYVNLEPCCHYGKQPPCVERIVKSGIKKVVIGMRDPNPAVNGKGIKYLQNHGINVTVGVAEDACQKLNEAYAKHIVTGLPLTVVKIAQTLDGKIAAQNGQSKWITSEKSRRYVHKLRSQHDAVLAGIGTILTDNPLLTNRLTSGGSPRRIVVDSQLRIPFDANILASALIKRTIIATSNRAPVDKLNRLKAKGAEVWVIKTNSEDRVDLPVLWKTIGKAGMTSVLVEGGSQIVSALLKAKLVDGVFIFIAPRILGNGINAIQNLGIENLEDSIILTDFHKKQMGQDVLLTGRIHKRHL